jgi:hypothetical protein
MKIQEPLVYLDHMIRQTRFHHVQLSSMADMKANFLLTLSSLMIPLFIHFMGNPNFRLACITMIGFCSLSVALSAYSTMPKIDLKPDQDRPPDLESSFFNILFFGNFMALDYEDFKGAMENIMNDYNRVYEVQLRDIYTLGNYLYQKKYFFLRLAYLSFIAGIIFSTILFGLTIVF